MPLLLNEQLIERFWRYVDKSAGDGCWLWTGAKNKGYGLFHAPHTVRATRYAAIIAGMPITNALIVMHICDNPTCVNPSHLRLGTHKDNSDDKIRKQRHAHGNTHGSRTMPHRRPFGETNGRHTNPEATARGERHGSAKLTTEDIVAIRNSPMSTRELGRIYGVSAMHVSDIKRRKKWAHVL